MTYATCEIALHDILALIPGFDQGNVIRGDYGMMSRGFDQAIVLTYSSFQAEDIAARGERNIHWGIVLTLYTRYTDDAQVHLDAAAHRAAVIAQVQSYPRLNHAVGVVQADIVAGTSGGEPPGGPLANIEVGGIHYYHELMHVEITENVEYTYAE